MTPISSTTVTQTNADFETQATGGTKAINVPPPPKNEVQQFTDGSSAPPSSGPASAAREATQPSSTGYAASVPAPNVDGASNTELNDAKQFEKDLRYITSIPNQDPFGAVGSPSRAWLQAVVNDPSRGKDSKDAAARLLASDIWGRADTNGNGRVSVAEASAYTDKLSGKAATSSSASVDSSDTTSTSATDDTSPVGDTSDSSSVSGSKPPSTKPGIEGALENLGNLGDDLQKQITDTINDKSMDATSKQAKLANLQSQQQAVMNMLTQISQMLQNVVKMWSDIAMNSVRNIR